MDCTCNMALVDCTGRLVMWLAKNFWVGQDVWTLINAPAELEAVIEPRSA